MQTDTTNLTDTQKTDFQNKLDSGFSNTQAMSTQVGPVAPPPIDTSTTPTSTINSSNLNGSTPVTIPPPPQPTYQATPTVVSPANSQVNNGVATVPPPPPPSEYQQTLDQLGALGGTLATKGQVTTDLQNQYGLADKTTAAVNSYNAYNQAKLDFQQQQEKLASTGNMTAGATNTDLTDFTRAGNANLANLAIQAQADQGLLTAAQQTIQYKLDAQFKPVQDQIDYLKSFAELNQNDLTKSQQVQLENQRFVLQNNLDQLKSAKSSANNFALQQGMADPNTLAKIDAAQTPAEAYAAVGGSQTGLPTTSGTGTSGTTTSPNAPLTPQAQLANLNPQYASYVKQTNDGTNYVSQDQLSNLSTFQQQEAARQYAKVGIHVLPSADATIIQNIQTTRQNLNNLTTLLVGGSTQDGTTQGVLGSGPIGRIGSSISNFIGGATQSNPSIAAINSYSTLAINALQALGAGQNSRITQVEINNQLKNIPTIFDSKETALEKVGILNSFLTNKSEQILPTTNSTSNSGTTGTLPPVQTKAGAINPNF